MRHPDYSQIQESALGLYTAQKNRLSYQQNGYYLQDQVEFGGLNLLGSLRYDNYRSVTTNYLQNGDKAWVSQDRVTKRLGALYAFDNGISPFSQLFRRFCAGVAAGYARGERRQADHQQNRWKAG